MTFTAKQIITCVPQTPELTAQGACPAGYAQQLEIAYVASSLQDVQQEAFDLATASAFYSAGLLTVIAFYFTAKYFGTVESMVRRF